MDSRPCDVTIVGTSISGMMAAAYLKHKMPDLDVVLVGPETTQERRPYVGESLVEPATLFLLEIGMGDHLRKNQLIKNGLSFYHKFAPEDPSDRRYSVHAPHKLNHLSRQLHRPAFDLALRRRAEHLGAEFVTGTAIDVETGCDGARHRVSVVDNHNQSVALSSPWVIDATGRTRLIGRKVTDYVRPPHEGQRSVFWFRLVDFEPFSDHIAREMRRGLSYDLWYTTHHFMGHGNWTWCIPLQSPAHHRMASIGITYRPDVFSHPMQSINDFLRYMDGEHPAIADMVRSGSVLDTHTYRDYLYWAREIYSADGWFLIGDAARAVDPLYSTGLSTTIMQIEQIGEMVRRRREASLSAEEIRSLAAVWQAVTDSRQTDITHQYATMHDPFQACMRRYWNLCHWFNGVLPLWYNGFFVQPDIARALTIGINRSGAGRQSAWELIGKVSQKLGTVTQSDFDSTVDFDWLINPAFDCEIHEVPRVISRVLSKRLRLRWNLVRLGGLRLLFRQIPYLLQDAVRAVAIRLFFRRVRGFSQVRRVLTFPHGIK